MSVDGRYTQRALERREVIDRQLLRLLKRIRRSRNGLDTSMGCAAIAQAVRNELTVEGHPKVSKY